MDKRDAARDLELCNNATWGEWTAIIGNFGSVVIFKSEKDGVIYEGDICLVDGGCNHKNDANFIAEAREALPYWLKRAQELEAENARLWAVVEAVRQHMAFCPPDK